MKLTFYGAAREVTGSCFLLETAGKNILIDCGMRQGPDIYEKQTLSFNAQRIHAVLITHAHIDHSGLLPLLYKNGFRGKIYMTRSTRDLANIMLLDSAHIQEFESEWRNRRAKRGDETPYSPLYETKDVLAVIKQFRPCDYDQPIEILGGGALSIRFVDAGHLLGSSSIEVTATEDGNTRKIVFSGDIGKKNRPIINNPTYLKDADFVVMESTYGDRAHELEQDQVKELADIIQETFNRGGNVIIPSFAVGRMQELLYLLREIKERNLVIYKYGNGVFPVYVDSPLALEATEVFKKADRACLDEATRAILDKGKNPLSFDGLITSSTTEESKNINFDLNPKVILSASGMCEAGRIRHHLKHNIWREDSTVLFAGYQVEGTLGRIILDGVEQIRLFSETISVKAKIKKLSGTSAHADDAELIEWVKHFEKPLKRVFVIHGEEEVSLIFARRLKTQLGLDSSVPYPEASWDLIGDVSLSEGAPRIKEQRAERRVVKNGHYQDLLNAGLKLLEIIKKNEGVANYELKRFTHDLESLAKKYDIDK